MADAFGGATSVMYCQGDRTEALIPDISWGVTCHQANPRCLQLCESHLQDLGEIGVQYVLLGDNLVDSDFFLNDCSAPAKESQAFCHRVHLKLQSCTNFKNTTTCKSWTS